MRKQLSHHIIYASRSMLEEIIQSNQNKFILKMFCNLDDMNFVLAYNLQVEHKNIDFLCSYK